MKLNFGLLFCLIFISNLTMGQCPTGADLTSSNKCFEFIWTTPPIPLPSTVTFGIKTFTLQSGLGTTASPALYRDLTTTGACSSLNVFNGNITLPSGQVCSYDVNGNLPITLTDFYLINDQSSIKVKFSTLSEINNDYFNIEHSADGIEFEAIGEINGTGNSNSRINYEFIDENPLENINYYRLKQTDFDGQYAYSDIKTILHKNAENFRIIQLSTQDVQIISTMQNYNINIYDAAGHEVKVFKLLSNNQLISIDDLRVGLYFVKVNGFDKVRATKIIKI
jgi:uncharacterized protein YjhX (UPF0386 family)